MSSRASYDHSSLLFDSRTKAYGAVPRKRVSSSIKCVGLSRNGGIREWYPNDLGNNITRPFYGNSVANSDTKSVDFFLVVQRSFFYDDTT